MKGCEGSEFSGYPECSGEYPVPGGVHERYTGCSHPAGDKKCATD